MKVSELRKTVEGGAVPPLKPDLPTVYAVRAALAASPTFKRTLRAVAADEALAPEISRQLDGYFPAAEIRHLAGLPRGRISPAPIGGPSLGHVNPQTLLLAVAAYEDRMRHVLAPDVRPRYVADEMAKLIYGRENPDAVRQSIARVLAASGRKSLGRAGRYQPRREPLTGDTKLERQSRTEREQARDRKRHQRAKPRNAWEKATPDQRDVLIEAEQRRVDREAALLAQRRAGAIDAEAFGRQGCEIDAEAISHLE